MKRFIRNLSIVAGVAVVLGSGAAWAASTGEIRTAVKDRYRPSRIELQPADQRGVVTKPGTVLVLLADGVPANVLRVSKPERPHPKIQTPPRVRHVDNYARVTADANGGLSGGPGELTLASGTRLVLFDVKVQRDKLSLRAHAGAGDPGRESGIRLYGVCLPAGIGRLGQ